MSAHTPGPWTAVFGSQFIRARGCTVAEVIPQPDGISAANARLIVAAPDMLGALRGLLAASEDLRSAARTPDADLPFGALRQAENIARAVVAKATGSAP